MPTMKHWCRYVSTCSWIAATAGAKPCPRNTAGVVSYTFRWGTSAAGSLKIALDTLFNHPNLPPFVGRQMIQRLVTSNPSPGYVYRVAQAFANNGDFVANILDNLSGSSALISVASV